MYIMKSSNIMIHINSHSNEFSSCCLKLLFFECSITSSFSRDLVSWSVTLALLTIALASWRRGWCCWWWLLWLFSLDMLFLRPKLPLRCRSFVWLEDRYALLRDTTLGLELVVVSVPSNGFTASGSTLFSTDLVCLMTIIMPNGSLGLRWILVRG